jgi:hypothetical protein
LLAVADDGVYNVASGERLFEIGGTDVEFSPDGSLLAVQNDAVYDLAQRQRLYPIETVLVEFSPNSRLLAVGGTGLLDARTGQLQFSFPNQNNVFALEFSSDGALLALVEGESEYQGVPGGVYTLVSEGEISIFEVESGEIRSSITSTESIDDIGFSPDGTRLALTSDGVYDTSNGEFLFSIGSNTDGFRNGIMRFSGDGSLLLLSEYRVYRTADGQRLLSAGGFYPDPHMISPDDTFIVNNRGVYASDGRELNVFYKFREGFFDQRQIFFLGTLEVRYQIPDGVSRWVNPCTIATIDQNAANMLTNVAVAAGGIEAGIFEGPSFSASTYSTIDADADFPMVVLGYAVEIDGSGISRTWYVTDEGWVAEGTIEENASFDNLNEWTDYYP